MKKVYCELTDEAYITPRRFLNDFAKNEILTLVSKGDNASVVKSYNSRIKKCIPNQYINFNCTQNRKNMYLFFGALQSL